MSSKKKLKKPPVDTDRVVRRLERARDKNLLVRVRRWIPYSDRVEGFVVGVGAAWVLLAKLDDRVRIDGWTLVRLRDTQAVAFSEPDCFEVRALKARDEWPPPPAVSVDLDDVVAMVESVRLADPLTTVFEEFARADACMIGVVRSVDDESLELLEIDNQGEWKRKPRWLDLDDVTRVEVGGGYEEALRLVAGPTPPG